MDRFIAGRTETSRACSPYLKSNMDRFIEDVMATVTDYILNLKSNMDRFIELIQQISLCQTQI